MKDQLYSSCPKYPSLIFRHRYTMYHFHGYDLCLAWIHHVSTMYPFCVIYHFFLYMHSSWICSVLDLWPCLSSHLRTSMLASRKKISNLFLCWLLSLDWILVTITLDNYFLNIYDVFRPSFSFLISHTTGHFL
jgi:hypothetical protein